MGSNVLPHCLSVLSADPRITYILQGKLTENYSEVYRTSVEIAMSRPEGAVFIDDGKQCFQGLQGAGPGPGA